MKKLNSSTIVAGICLILLARAAAADSLIHFYSAGSESPRPGCEQFQQSSLTLADIFNRAQIDPELLQRKRLVINLVFLSPDSHSEMDDTIIHNMMKHSIDWRDTDLLHGNSGNYSVIVWVGAPKELKRLKKSISRAVKLQSAPGDMWPPQYGELMDLSKKANDLQRWPGGETWNKLLFTHSKPAAPEEPISPDLALEDVQFGRIAAGANKVWVKIHNTSDQPQILGMHVQANSQSTGWGTQHTYPIAPRREQWCTFVFKLQRDLDKHTNIRLSFANVKTAEYDASTHTLIKKYTASNLESRPHDNAKSRTAPPEMSDKIVNRFIEIQELLRREEYDPAWSALDFEYQAVQYWGKEAAFVREMQKLEPLSGWSRKDFTALHPTRVDWQGSRLVLNATLKGEPWKIAFIKDNDWKIENIEGYTDRIVSWNTWQERLLPTMTKATTRHFEIYCAKGSPAERDLETIKREREEGYRKISKLLGVKTKQKIRLVFFDSKETKYREMGHQGMGLAKGNLEVEVYNDSENLDPYHETAHVIAREVGNPPAMFSEGFAVCVAEQMGAPPLKNLGGGTASITARARQLKSKNEWIDPAELLTWTDIGPEKSRPPVSYPEAASFDKFLIDTYGKAKFVEAYKTLKCSSDESTQRQNQLELERIYAQPLNDLVKAWYSTLEP